MSKKSIENILFFDGVCSLCNSAVDFFISNDKNKMLKYSPLQGITAKKLLEPQYINDLNTVVLYQNGKIYTKSEAIIRGLSSISLFYRPLIFSLILPVKLRDFIYDLIAKNRYKFFGKKDSCRLPTPEERELFLD